MSGPLPPDQLAIIMTAVVVGVPLAAIAHELTHVAVIWPVAEDVEVRVRQLVVLASIEETPGRQRVARLAGLAPLIVGVIVAVGLVAAGRPLAEPWTPQGLAEWGIWICYSVTGGKSDYLPSVSRERGSEDGQNRKPT
jgi:hypothetical protein